MSENCEHVKEDGCRCENPAMYRRDYCYYHWRLEMLRRTSLEDEHGLPLLDSDAGVQLAAQQIYRSLLSGTIEPFRAQTLLASLRLVSTSLNRIKKSPAEPEQMVRELTPAMEEYFGVKNPPPDAS
jgi:hypothetical protein